MFDTSKKVLKKRKFPMIVILNEVKNPSVYTEERYFVLYRTQHDSAVAFSIPC